MVGKQERGSDFPSLKREVYEILSGSLAPYGLKEENYDSPDRTSTD